MFYLTQHNELAMRVDVETILYKAAEQSKSFRKVATSFMDIPFVFSKLGSLFVYI